MPRAWSTGHGPVCLGIVLPPPGFLKAGPRMCLASCTGGVGGLQGLRPPMGTGEDSWHGRRPPDTLAHQCSIQVGEAQCLCVGVQSSDQERVAPGPLTDP